MMDRASGFCRSSLPVQWLAQRMRKGRLTTPHHCLRPHSPGHADMNLGAGMLYLLMAACEHLSSRGMLSYEMSLGST